ncbi:MAG TPA: nitroreductase family protein [Ktedonobacterales bacterium]|jgi:nitroreductase|nr:nitroreductase family protein [Ktedonobacterales bacterium]
MDVVEAIRTKRAVRQFATRPLPDEAILAILNAGRRAQSSKNTQPWHFVAVSERDTLRQLSTTGDFAGHLAGAALGVMFVVPDQADRREWLMFDLGQAASYMQLAAWELGIGSAIATIYHPDQAQAILGIPDGYRCDVALSLGYPAQSDALTAAPKPGGRRPLDEMVHRERW